MLKSKIATEPGLMTDFKKKFFWDVFKDLWNSQKIQ